MNKASGEGLDPALVALGRRIASSRKKAGATQEHLAHEAEIALRSLQNAESGRLNPTYLNLRKIATALGLPISKLLSGL